MTYIAEQVRDAFRNSKTTVSVNTLAQRAKGERLKHTGPGWGQIRWKFPDGSILQVSGRGASHKMSIALDLTPTWAQILPTWLHLYKQGIRDNNAEVIANAELEFGRMAEAADRWNASNKD